MDKRRDSLMRTLAQAILQDEDAAACETCLDDLEAYVALQLDGGAYVEAMPQVAAHLDGCVACSQSYALLYTVMLDERRGTLPVVNAIPAPDLSFLPARPSLGEALRGAVEQWRAGLRLRFSQPLLDLLHPTTQPALAFRDTEGTPLFALELPTPGVAVERLSVAIYADEQADDRVLVQVGVTLPGRAWPDLAGIAITLGGPGVSQHTTTDPWGEATFEDVPRSAVPDLVVEVGAGDV